MPRDPIKNPRDDRVRAQHMLEAARDVIQLAARRQRDDLHSDMQMRRAIVNAIQEIGEAAAKVSEHGRSRVSDIPWPAVVGMRNRLVHGYDAIDYDAVWKVATEEVPVLVSALERAFESWPITNPPSP